MGDREIISKVGMTERSSRSVSSPSSGTGGKEDVAGDSHEVSTDGSGSGSGNESEGNGEKNLVPVPLKFKLASIVLVSMIGFGSSWSSGITGAMKTELKKGLSINNTQYALISASEDFMVTALVLLSGVVTDKIGGAKAILYGNIIYTIGSILIAVATTIRSYKFMIFGQVILALGDIATQIAQYKIFSSWFPPSGGFASTLGLELGIGKIGGFVGKSTANIISTNLGDFSWVFWIASFMNLFTNFMTLVFYLFSKYCAKTFESVPDPATGEVLSERNKRWEVKRVLELPWTFWGVMAFSAFETSMAIVFQQNATELAEVRWGIDTVKAGWYTSVLQYAGFFVVPCLGVFIDVYGNRITMMVICGLGVCMSMALINWATTASGTAAAFGIYAVAYSLGPTTIIDSIRTSMWHSSVFGSAYACKITMNNAMNIIIRIVTGVLQDQSPSSNPYKKVTPVYLILSTLSVVVSLTLLTIFLLSKYNVLEMGRIYVDIAKLQWTRKQRFANGALIAERAEMLFAIRKEGSDVESLESVVHVGSEEDGNKEIEGNADEVVNNSKSKEFVVVVENEEIERRNGKERVFQMLFSRCCFGLLVLLVLGSWGAYFWGVATGNND